MSRNATRLLSIVFLTLLLAGLALVKVMDPADAVAAPHRIRADAGGLYDSVTGARFVPRGSNFVRVRTTSDGTVYHSTFEPGFYDRGAARHALTRMRQDGYNTVRVFIEPGGLTGDPRGIGHGLATNEPVYGPYMDNFADFAAMAAERGIYVLPALLHFPQNKFYWDVVARTHGPGGAPKNIAGRNLLYLDKGRVAAKAEYMKRFAAALIDRIGREQAPVILAYETDNEVYFEANQAPYDKMSGTVTPLNGVTYDMSDPGRRQQSADASLVEYSRRLKRALSESDRGALMTTGFYTNRAVGKTRFNGFLTHCSTSCDPKVNYRVPGRPAALSKFGDIDFLDIHLYPNPAAWDAAGELATIEKDHFAKPYIVGEFGARKSVYGNDLRRAAFAMRDAQVAMCGQGADGWLFWTWDTHENLANQELFYKLDENRGAINGVLAPVARPDPCRR